MNPWEPELHVHQELAKKLIEDQFPQLAPVRLESFGQGWDNIVYRVQGKFQDKWLFRFPQREMAVAGVEREINCLPILSQLLGRVPILEFAGQPSKEYPWPFWGYRPVEGSEVINCDSQKVNRDQIAQTLGVYLKELHSSLVSEKLKAQLPADPLGRLDFKKRIPMTESRIEDLKSKGIVLPWEKLTGILRLGLNTPVLPCHSVVHGDLHFRHLIIDDNGEFAGLIDWGDIHLNDPAVDLQIYWSFFSPKQRQIFLQAYGPLSELQRVQSRAFSVFVNIALLISSISQELPKITAESYAALANLLQDDL